MREELYEISNTILNPSVRAWKEQGRKVIGFLCSYVPEELISAAGILPYRIRGTGCIKSIRGDEWMSNFSCSFARSCLEFAMNGTYDFLDGLVALDSCGQIHRLYDNWRFNARLPFMHFLSVPHKNTESAVLWYRDEIAGLKQGLEEFSGEEITREKLGKAIRTYNETGNLLREVYELRKGSVPPITGYETLRLVLAAMSMPREDYNKLLKTTIEEIKTLAPKNNYRARLMVIGSANDDPAFIKIIENQGGVVVTDALCFGSRYFWEPVDIEEDLLLSLARSYLSRPSCPRMVDQHFSIFEFIRDMVREFNVDGIIYQKMQFCDLWGGESLYLENRLKESKIPFLSIQREHIITNAGQIGVRVDAFIETIEGVI